MYILVSTTNNLNGCVRLNDRINRIERLFSVVPIAVPKVYVYESLIISALSQSKLPQLPMGVANRLRVTFAQSLGCFSLSPLTHDLLVHISVRH